MEFELTDDEKITLLKIARNTVASLFSAGSGESYNITPSLSLNCGAFVTLHKKDGSLRGCIGHIASDRPLTDTVRDMAVASSTQDPRFPKVSKDELDNLEIEISVLSPFTKINSIEEIEVGRHGIMMRRGYRSGLLLPQVASEYNWDRETFLTHTCYKAGMDGSCWKNSDTIIEIFHAIVFSEKELL